MGRVQDQAAVVTGAAKGLGKSIALRLAEDGARVVLGDIDGPGLAATATAVREAGGEAVTVVGDITEEEPAAQLIESAIEHYKQIDILVNNVGGLEIQRFGKCRSRIGTTQLNSICAAHSFVRARPSRICASAPGGDHLSFLWCAGGYA